MYVVNGIIKYNKIKDETVLHINISNSGTRTLLDNIQKIIQEYKKNITVIELSGSEGDLNEIVAVLKIIHENGLKTGYSVMNENVSDINDKLLCELDYVDLNGKIQKIDYCPFADSYDWIDV